MIKIFLSTRKGLMFNNYYIFAVCNFETGFGYVATAVFEVMILFLASASGLGLQYLPVCLASHQRLLT